MITLSIVLLHALGQEEVPKQPPSCKFIVTRIERTGWILVEGSALWVRILLALWRVPRWEMIWSFFGDVFGLFLVF
jgi:hypothetical protein